MDYVDLCYVPIYIDGLDVSALENSEIQVLNRYHRTVYEKLAPFFDGEELEWLKNATREI